MSSANENDEKLYPDINNNQSKIAKSADYSELGVGPASQKRHCTDILFLLLFILFWIGMIAIGGVAIQQGNLDRLRYGNDSEGNLCGVNNELLQPASDARNLVSKPNQYLFNPTNPQASYRICMEKCPSKSWQPICPYDTELPSGIEDALFDNGGSSSLEPSELILFLANGTLGNCSLTIKSSPVLNRCVPDIAELGSFLELAGDVGLFTGSNSSSSITSAGTDIATQLVSDLYNSWWVILSCSALALVLAFFWLIAIQWFGKQMVWLTIIGANLAALGMTGAIWAYYFYAKSADAGSSADANQSAMNKFIQDSFTQNEQVLLVLAVIFSVFSGIMLLITLFIRKRIKLAIALIERASIALRQMPMILVFPVVKYIALCLLLAWVLYVWAMLATAGEQKIASAVSDSWNSSSLPSTTNNSTAGFVPNSTLQYLMIYYLFGLFWTFNWILAISQATIAGAIGSWYWTMPSDSASGNKKSQLPKFTVFRSFYRILRYHLGSLAFGSAILAIVQSIRAFLLYVQAQLQKQSDTSKLAKYMLACLQCCFACVENVLRFLSKNAYIEIAAHGYGFCRACRQSFGLLVRNAVRVVVVDKVGDFLFFLGRVMITLVCGIVGAVLLNSGSPGAFWSVSLIIIMVLAYVVSSVFVSVFDMAISTLFLCFCEDCERNDGSAEKPYYADEGLRKFIDDSAADAASKSKN